MFVLFSLQSRLVLHENEYFTEEKVSRYPTDLSSIRKMNLFAL